MASNNNNVHPNRLPSMDNRIKKKLYAALMDRSPEPRAPDNLNLRKELVEKGDTGIIMENMDNEKLHRTIRQKIERTIDRDGKDKAMMELLDVVVNNDMIEELYSALIHASQRSLADNIVKKYSEIKDMCGRTF